MDMTCEGCANAAKRVLGKLGADKVTDVKTDIGQKRVTVTSSLPPDKLLLELKKTGKQVSLLPQDN